MTISVKIDKKGTTTVDADGFTGGSCEEATAAIREAVGMEIDHERKAEFYENEEHEGV